MKQLWLRRVCALLVFAMILSMLPMTVFAADVNTGVTGLTADSSGLASWSYSDGTIVGSVKASSSESCGSTTYTAQTGTLTFTNNSGSKAQLSFDYSLELNGGSATVDGTAVTAGAGFSKTLAAGETIAVTITSPKADATTSITISNLKLTAEQNVSITFKAPSHGSYTVNEAVITTQMTLNVMTTDTVTLAATPASGYKFFGWYSETTGNYFSTTATLSTSFASNQTVYPVFISGTTPVFQVGTKVFTELNDATSYAQSSGIEKIVLISDGTLPAGNYSIPSGKTLLIPYKSDYAVVTNNNLASHKVTNIVTATPYKTLTLAANAKVTVQGSVSVASGVHQSSTGQTGPYGCIQLNANSDISFESGSNLYAFGYIKGTGTVSVKSGAKVYENLFIADYPGSASTVADLATAKVFPFAKFTVRNVEAPMTLYSGAIEEVYCNLYGSNALVGYREAWISFVGTSSSLFQTSGSITKSYSGGRQIICTNGTSSISPMEVTIYITASTSSMYGIEIPYNYTLEIESGTVTIKENIVFSKGTITTVDDDATVVVESDKNIYVLDKAEDPLSGGTASAKLDVNGTVIVNGAVWTSLSKANITSSHKTGLIQFNASVSESATKTIKVKKANNAASDDITMYPASLKNGDGTFTETAGTASGDYYRYSKVQDKWVKNLQTYEVKWLDEEGNVLKTDDVELNVKPQYTGETPQKESDAQYTYIFDGWTQEGEETVFTAETLPEVTGNVSYYAHFAQIPKTYTVTWEDEDGTPLQVDQLENGTHPVYSGKAPTKTETPYYTYAFDKWMVAGTDEEYTDATVVNGADMTLYPTFTATRKTLTVTFHANNGTDVTATQTMNTVEETALQANTFTYPSYKFLGWATNASGEKVYNDEQTVEFDGNVDLYAVWERATITVSFDANAEDATGTMDSQTVSIDGGTLNPNEFKRVGYVFVGWNTKADGSGASYEDKGMIYADEDITLYAQWEIQTFTITWDIEGKTETEIYPYGATPSHAVPEKEDDAQYSYTFAGWHPDIAVVTEDATYNAAFERTVKKYTITFQDYNGAVLQSTEVEYGTVPTAPADPTRASTEQYDYTFTGWDQEIVAVTGPATYTATYTSTVRSYDVTWIIDGASETEPYEYGETPSHAEPSKEPDAQYTYSFTGWDPEIVAVTGPATYTAKFEGTLRSYSVKFLNEDGTEVKSETLDYGTTITAPADPTKENTPEKVYTFLGWFTDDDLAVQWTEGTTVTGEVTYKAKFSEADQFYTVIWLDGDGSELGRAENVLYNQIPPYTGEKQPTKEATAQYTYEFSGDWEPALNEETFTYTLTPKFYETLQQYTVTFVIGDQYYPVPYVYGDTPAFDGTPEKASDAQYTYTFTGWSPEIAPVTGDATYTAVFEGTLRSYTVTWVIDGVEETQTYQYGTTPSHADPEKDGDAQYTYTFTGWRPEITTVTGDATYTAQFDQTVNTYLIKFVDEDGTVLDTKTIAYGDIPATDVVPTKNDTITKTYTFAGWADEIGTVWNELPTVTGEATYKATYTETERSGWVSFEGKLYYIVDGAPLSGIARLPYPDDAGLGYAENPEDQNDANYPNDGKSTFIFDENGVLQSDVNGFFTFLTAKENAAYPTAWLADGAVVWAVNGEILWHPGEVKVDGDYYYFASANNMIKGRDYNVTRVHDLQLRGRYTFNDEGKVMMYDGITNVNGTDYYYVNGVKTYAGLIKIGDDLYYINSACEVVKNRSYYVSKTNGLLPAGMYNFDADGKLIVDAPTKNGIVKETETDWYYYVDGVKVYAGLIEIDGSLYYVNSAFQVIHGRDYYVSKTNGLKLQGTYTFDAEGKLVEKDTTLNGIVKDGDTWYYYVDGIKTYAGLVEIDGAFYYVKTDKTVVHGQEYYVSKTNGLKPSGKYTFDDEGKLVELDGIVKDGDVWTYYANGVKMYAGLIEINGALYYVKSDCTVVHGAVYYVSKTNGLKPAGNYSFDEDGKLVELDGIVKNGDVWTYYVNGAKTYAGLIEIDGSYYYVKSDCTVVHGQKYYVSKTNDLLPAGFYTFDVDGKMV